MEIIKVNSDSLIEKVVLLADEIWHEHYINIISSAQIDYMLNKFQSFAAVSNQIQNDRYDYYLLCLGEEAFGFFAVCPKDNSLFLSKIYIRREFRAQGYGGRAMSFIKGLAQSLKLPSVFLTVNRSNTNSINAYLSMGFQIVGEMDSDIGGGYEMNDYKMEVAVS
jgi:ribosomal protein S18 acetylase RimI-like enzyme